MFNVDTIVGPYVERWRPHVQTWAERCDLFMSGVIERLDRIAAATEDDTNQVTTRPHLVRNLVSGQPVPLVDSTGGEIPPAEEWELEYWVGTLDAAAPIRLYNSLADAQATGGAVPLAVLAIAGVNGFLGQLGNGLVIQGGNTPYLVAAGNGGVRLQFRRCQRAHNRPGITGLVGVTPDRMDAGQETALERRHAGTFTSGRNAVGERVGDL